MTTVDPTQQRLPISFEFFPPKTPEGVDKLAAVRQQLYPLKPEYCSVTYGAGGSTQDGTIQTVRAILAEGFDLIVADLSFIALSKIVPHLAPWLKPGGQVLMLIKPQFEVGKDHVGKGGVVKDPAQHARARDMVRRACTDLGWTVHKGFASSIAGGDGNLEFFIWAQSPQA